MSKFDSVAKCGHMPIHGHGVIGRVNNRDLIVII